MPLPLQALIGFGLNSMHALRCVDFLERAFDASVQSRQRLGAGCFERWQDIDGGAECVVLSLGETRIEVLQFDQPGRAIAADLSALDTQFQHLAIVVSDMQQALRRLAQVDGWHAITRGGPQTLPKSSGSVTAFKFLSPDGHPLELLQFPHDEIPAHWQRHPGSALFLGVDHSAISVAEPERSIVFYDSLGLRVASRTLNFGAEQERLDGISDPHVDLIALTLPLPTPHVELLHYRTVHTVSKPAAANDTAATRLIFSDGSTAVSECGYLLRDPDGHCLQIKAS